jgi:hypothetical protein
MEALTHRGTTSQPDEEAEGLPAGGGVEHMNNNYDARLWDLLEKKKLANLSQFHQEGFFDEVPLYTRKSDVDFLSDGEKANEILLKFALKFLKSVLAYEQHSKGYFAAITVWYFSDDGSDDRLVPNLFAWCGPVKDLRKKLALQEVTSVFGKRIKKLVPKLRMPDQFGVLEDTETEPSGIRVFIAPKVQPYRGFVTLDHLRSRSLNSK